MDTSPLHVEVTVLAGAIALDDEMPEPVSDPRYLAVAIATWRDWFQHWINYLKPELSKNGAYELSLRLTDDAEMQSLNAQFRQQDQPTDVLAFAALEADLPQPEELVEGTPLYLGDLVISVETAERQAQERGHELASELAWLAAHGLLHLLGWDHPDEESLTRMLDQQEDLLQIVGVSIKYDDLMANSAATGDV